MGDETGVGNLERANMKKTLTRWWRSLTGTEQRMMNEMVFRRRPRTTANRLADISDRIYKTVGRRRCP